MNKFKDDATIMLGRLITAGAKVGLTGLPLVIASTTIPGVTGVIIGVLGAGTVIAAMKTKDNPRD